MENKFLLGSQTVEQQVTISDVVHTKEVPANKFFSQMANYVPFDTGLLPPGLRSYTQTGDESQIVIVCPPGINYINWGAKENDPNCKTYLLAQPWRVLIVDMVHGDLLGARMFYSPSPVTSIDQPLYHQNVPNLNCQGYGGTAVGWVCLYHTESWKNYTLGQKVERVIERCSGVEAYNNANMSRTDGPRFYKKMKKPSYVYRPDHWENKTEKEGVIWTFDEELWIPVMVRGINNQSEHLRARRLCISP